MNIIMKVKEFRPDPNQYRQNRVVFEPLDTYVRVDIPEDYCGEAPDNNTGIILTLEGWRYVQELLDNTLEDKPKDNPVNAQEAEDIWKELEGEYNNGLETS